MNPIHIITVEVRGGLIVDVTHLPVGVAIRIVDHDNIAQGDADPPEDHYDYFDAWPNPDGQLNAIALTIDFLNHLIRFGRKFNTPIGVIDQAMAARRLLLRSF